MADIDQPHSINAFLSAMKSRFDSANDGRSAKTPVTLNPETQAFRPASKWNDNWTDPNNDLASVSAVAEANSDSSPHAHPSEPLAQAQTNGTITHLRATEEHGGETLDENVQGHTPLKTMEVQPSKSPSGLEMTPTQKTLLGKKGIHQADREQKVAEMEKHTQGWMENVLETFRKSHEPRLAQYQNDNEQGDAAANNEVWIKGVRDTVPFPEFDESPVHPPVQQMAQMGPAAPASPTSETFVAEERRTSPASKPVENTPIQEEDSEDEGVGTTAKTTGNGAAARDIPSPPAMVAGSSETESSTEGDDEDREHQTHFKSWGVPTGRGKPRSRVRTVILEGLPRTANFRLVQSLIHGGSIETMRLSPVNMERSTVSAYVTLTSPDACEDYFRRYPNGMDIRHQGKKYPVLVNKAEKVDVVSGMMQGYLGCGATRAVKVLGAEDEWGIVALHKLAQGRTQSRQVEAINDSYHNGERSITFRFTNIADAVKFKGVLIRDDEWEGCPVEFAEDPCEKATGILHD